MSPDQIRTIPDLQSFLHSYSIRYALKHPGEETGQVRTPCQTIIDGLNTVRTVRDPMQIADVTKAVRRCANGLAELDPALSWLPTWKPRVAVEAKGG